jgi:uncharacterized membrane protein
LVLAWLTAVWASARLRGRGGSGTQAMVAASPILIFQAFTNFDALATAFATGALLAWARRKPWLAGALIGLGVAAKMYPLLLFVPLVLLGLRNGRLREVGKAAIATVLTWLVVNLPSWCCSRADGRSSSGSTRAAAMTWTRCTTW